MRIVGGKHRGREIVTPTGTGVRPTLDRAREAMFNIITHSESGANAASPIVGARVLDAFAGSGALGLESLSRGAAHASFIERDSDALAALRTNVDALGESPSATVLAGDARSPVHAAESCDIIFLDPPYDQGLADRSLQALKRAGWLAPSALCVIEMSARETFVAPPGFTVIDERRYGKSKLVFLRWSR